jgi:hypothetical protein
MSFGTAVENVRLLQLVGHLPSVLVIGIGYVVPGLAPVFPLRRRDLTPATTAVQTSSLEGEVGGADKFLVFIGEELQPWVRDTFGTRPGEDTYFGHSLGGLFAAHVLFTAPDTFRRYGLGSPSFWWGDGAVFEEENQYFQRHDDLRADVFMSVGGEETNAGAEATRSRMTPAARQAAVKGPAPKDMVGDMNTMVHALQSRAYPSLRLGSTILDGEDHASSQPINLSRALRFLLQPVAATDRL